MAKDAFWFKHDSNAGRDIKLLQIKHLYTHWGIGIFWEVVEILREQDDYCFNADESSLQLLCSMIGCNDTSKFINLFNDFIRVELFVKEKGVFKSESLIRRMKVWETKKDNGSKGGKTPKKKRNKSEFGSEFKADGEQSEKRNGSIREEKRREEEIRKEKIRKEAMDWEFEKGKIVSDTVWQETYVRDNKYDSVRLTKRLSEYLLHIQNGEDFKTCAELKKHFANWNKGDLEKFNQKYSTTIM